MSNYATLPPEINSALMYGGPGPAPLQAAATAWQQLGEELSSTANEFAALASGLSDVWQGPAAAAMSKVAIPYAQWLQSTATGATRTANAAAAAISEFELALTTTVDPELVAHNRSQLLTLVRTNLLGLNAPAIAGAEALYEEMWARDVATMAAYHAGASEAIAQLAAWPNVLATLPAQLSGVGTAAASDVTLVIGGSGFPIPSPSYVNTVLADYVTPNFPSFTVANAVSLFTPAESYWITGVKSLIEDASWAQGLPILDNAIKAQIAAGNNVVVQGYSQGAGISSLEMAQLKAAGVPTSAVSFALVGDPMNPNGGLYSRFNGLTLPSIGKTFWGATPANDYPTAIYTLEYDGFADFPQYPLNLVSDANAVFGMFYVHTKYPHLPLDVAQTAFTLPTSGPSLTTYYMIPTENLPLLEPLRETIFIGNPLADLIQPSLKVIVNLGYGDSAHGYSTGYADVPTPFGLFPNVNPATVLSDLAVGAQQGVSDATADISAMRFPSLSDLSSLYHHSVGSLSSVAPPDLQWPSINTVIDTLKTANTDIVYFSTKASSAIYASLLPVADTTNAELTSLPSYDFNLFLDGLQQAVNGDPAGIVRAFLDPIAANAGLFTFLTFFEVYAVYHVWQEFWQDVYNRIFGVVSSA